MPKSNPNKQKASLPSMEDSIFRWLPTGAQGLQAMLDAIAEAALTIEFEMYIFSPGPIAARFREALVQARLRGVRVRVLLDAFGSFALPMTFWNTLVQHGGEVRWFNAFRVSERYGRRNHRKLLVVDSQTAIVGGFNVSDEYNGDGISHGWRDLGLHIRGPLATALEGSFTDLFEKVSQPAARFPKLYKTPETTVQGHLWTLLLTEPGWGHRAFKRALIHDLTRARCVQIICAYFVPTWRLRRALMGVTRRGGRVQLILAGHSDMEASRLASHSLYAKLMQAGVEIYEYQPQILHAKLLIIDDVVYAGSANLDARSLNINHELMIRIADQTTAAKARVIFDGDLPHCRSIDPEKWRASRSFFTRFIERAAYFLVARIDPHITSLRWRDRARRALEKRSKG